MPKSIVNMSGILSTYGYEQQVNTALYFKVIKLRKMFKYGDKKLASIFNVKETLISDWLYRDTKPIAVRTLLMCKKNKWLPLYPSPGLSRILGYLIGDGHITKNLTHTYFYGKKKYMKKPNEFINEYFGIRGVIRRMNNGVHSLEVSNTALTRLLYCAGVPKGNKTKQVYDVPDWILYPEQYGCTKQESHKIQKAFLQGLNDSETTQLSIKKNTKSTLQEIIFEISTHKFSQQFNFILQLKQLYKNFDLNVSEFNYKRFRRNKLSWRIGFRIKGIKNIIIFFNQIGFYFNEERAKASLEILKHVCKLRLSKIKIYERALKMRKDGMSYYKISEILNIPVGTIEGWCSRDKKPLCYSIRNALENVIQT